MARSARAGGAAWREVYAQMGAKPKYLPSVQALLEIYEREGSVPVPLRGRREGRLPLLELPRLRPDKLDDNVHDALFVFDLLKAPGTPGPAVADDVVAGVTALLEGVEATWSGAADGDAVSELRLG